MGESDCVRGFNLVLRGRPGRFFVSCPSARRGHFLFATLTPNCADFEATLAFLTNGQALVKWRFDDGDKETLDVGQPEFDRSADTVFENGAGLFGWIGMARGTWALCERFLLEAEAEVAQVSRRRRL